MQPIRVLIVDDSALIRRLLAEVLAADSEIVIAGAVGSGRLALSALPQLKPDLVTLDVEMAGMDGITTLVELRKIDSRLPVIMFSSLTAPGAAATLEALARGASDYATKPSYAGSQKNARLLVREELIPKIKALCEAREKRRLITPAHGVVAPVQHHPTRIDLIAIATSTGGPNVLGELMPQFPRDFPLPVVIVQHMPATFTKLFAVRLNGLTQLQVQEGRAGQTLEKGQVWIAPGGFHMTVLRQGSRHVLGLNRDPRENSCRPAADVLFRSAAHTFKESVLAVVLTGMGSDGTLGSAAIRSAGGAVIVQDEASSVVWGMPGSVVAAKLADRICPLNDVVPEILRRVSFRRGAAVAAHS